MSRLKQARQKLEELGYDPIEALVEIARNRNQLADLRLRAAMALLPYAYAQIPAKLDVSVTDKTGVMVVPVPVSEDEWENQVNAVSREALKLNKPLKVIDAEELPGDVRH